jgi:hypothetical protein
MVFYFGAYAHVAGIRLVKTDLAVHAVGIEDTPAGNSGRIGMPIGQGRFPKTLERD